MLQRNRVTMCVMLRITSSSPSPYSPTLSHQPTGSYHESTNYSVYTTEMATCKDKAFIYLLYFFVEDVSKNRVHLYAGGCGWLGTGGRDCVGSGLEGDM